MQRLKFISEVTREDASSLRNYENRFLIVGPRGEAQSVRLYLYGLRSKVWSMQFDLWPSDWNLGETREVRDFCRDNSAYWHAHPKQLPKRGVSLPNPGGACGLTFSVLKEDAAEWIVRAVGILAKSENLCSINFFDTELLRAYKPATVQ